MEELEFEVVSRLGRRIRVSRAYWNYIVTVKHRSVKGLERGVIEALRSPAEIRKSRRNSSICLYYGRFADKLMCVVVKHLNGEGYIITAYLTRKFALGEVIWKS
jgi:hypothetical protein